MRSGSQSGTDNGPAGGRSLRRWSVLISAVLVVILLGAFAVVLSAIGDLSRARSRLLDVVGPAVVSAQQWGSDLVDQETGVRGFILSRDEAFLGPYADGLIGQEVARAAIVAMGSPEVDAGLAAVDAAVATWRDGYAEPAIDAVRAGTDVPGDSAGKRQFDAVRAALSVLRDEMADQRADGRTALNDAATRMAVTCIIALGVVLIAVCACVVAVHMHVVRPLSTLRGQVGRVSSGEFGHTVAATGPQELLELGHGVDIMRRRIVDELDHARDRNTALDAATEDLRRSNAELEQFAYVASHDLQEPLRKIASFCQLLEQRYGDRLDDRATQYIAFAVDGAKRMQVLINDLLAFSRVGRNDDKKVVVAAADLVDAARHNLAEALDSSGARVEVGDLPAVRAVPGLVTAVFQNLIGNAVKFRAAQTPVVRVDAEPGEDDTWVFSVSDNGIGIEQRYAERVFVIFQRLHPKDRYPGTGIGLALCRKIVEFHGGRIWLDTDVTGGTTVRFTLPKAHATVG
ncbi:ATP-binding protein [Actinosynnema sp. NPDC047251]|uniref:sensor histidine kinase n=1 Tax=Saccharothrix espanaensis TaxID=103731 RepID=UPI000302DA26|nr:ATP-binding protein [Saccharothrix espanaensis]